MVNLVLIDTCIWVSFFSRKKSIHKTALGELLEEDRAAIIGPILAELLLGFKKEKEAEWVASSLAGLHFLDLSWDDWCAAAKLGRHLAAKKHQLPLSDLVLAAIAQKHSCFVYSIDPHFEVIPNLDTFRPQE